jgi:beta-phosphoglucomutase
MAIGSSGPPENVQLVLDCLDGAEHITASVTGKDVTKGKPDPQVFVIAAGKLGVDPIRCAVLEDAPAGVQAARRANMAAVALTGTADRDTLAADADVVVESLRELTPESLATLIDSRGSGS